jgi:hypothetical protein
MCPAYERRIMNGDCSSFSFQDLFLALPLAALLLCACGCSLMNSGESSRTSAWSDSSGQDAGGAAQSSAGDAPAKKEPFWEKYRDKRVNQINQNLNVEEPAGW